MKLILLVILSLLESVVLGRPAMGQQKQPVLTMQVPFNPEVVLISGKPTVYYELRVSNAGPDSIHLQQLEVMGLRGAPLLRLDQYELGKRVSREKGGDSRWASLLQPGGAAIIYLEVQPPANKPGQLSHRLSFEAIHNQQVTMQIQQDTAITYKPTTLVLGPPLRQGNWVAIYDPAWPRGHRRVVYAPDGTGRIPGRFAIDFIQLNSLGQYATGDENNIKNWLGYAAPVIAVADGVVVAAKDSFPESATLSAHPVHPSDKATGNYIALDLGNGHIVFYEHLKPGSIRVKVGQAVKKGEPIAALGFTGQTTGPHLHFHVANANSPLGAEGIPFAFERFTLLGAYVDLNQFGKAPWKAVRPALITRQRPAPNAVIRF